ncbi:DEAD/DEAH box helicase [Bradyrhizobium valentinum]|uniref:DEAD/DEAH box helicase n=1 Tax=Bradyrhizobium valentinum TaxID=1518501 RepID=UPI000AF14EDF|nr:DEAD/DEAH box helicase family protein [Bradyrhizobium valentinum]
MEVVIPHALGQIRHVLRSEVEARVNGISEIKVSARIKEPLYRLDNGESVVITERRQLARPEDVDGVLQRRADGSFRWLAHRLIETFLAEVAAHRWPAAAAKIASAWDNKVRFKSERRSPDGEVTPGNEGLRPPQIGALHAIGAHWSLSKQPATIVMPTGTGKTETMLATLAAFVRGPMIVIVPWDLLRAQTARKFLTFGLLRKLGFLTEDAPNPVVGIITHRPNDVSQLDILESCNVIVATAGALSTAAALPLAPEIAKRCAALVIDEAHHVAASNCTEFRSAFHEQSVLQFTATPFRRDRRLVTGAVIYSYPLRNAQKDGYFKKIAFEPVYEIDQDRADRAIAATAVARLREDLAAGRNHLLMARCVNISRADAVYKVYEQVAPDLAPMLVHSEMGDTDSRLTILRAGQSRIVVCVNMLGEGFDLPQLKIAAVHDMHRSLAILLQFIGRFTRTAGENIGDATAIANIADPDVSGALERLYSEDADWNELLSEMSSEAAKEHAELVAFLNASQKLKEDDEQELVISHQLLRPALSTVVYKATEFWPRRFHEGLTAERRVHAVWLHTPSNTLYFVTRIEPKLRWTRAQEMRDRQWALFMLHYDADRKLLHLSSTDHSSLFNELAAAVAGDVQLISGDTVFRTLGRINRLIFQNVGVKKHGRRNLSFASYTGADVATALGLAERAGSVKNNLSGTGWEDGRRVAVGCSYKGRVWSREQGSIPAFVKWCAKIGEKLLDETIDTREIISHVLIPEEVTALPDKEVLGIEWPVELLGQSEERITLGDNSDTDQNDPFYLFELRYTALDRQANKIHFELSSASHPSMATFALTVGGEGGFKVEQLSGKSIYIFAGGHAGLLADLLSSYPPMVRFVDLCELDGNMLIWPQQPHELAIPADRFESWNWSGTDLTKESIWKDDVERKDSIQWRAAQHYIGGKFDVVFDDDAAGEAADLVCLKEEDDCIRLALIDCKFSGGATAGERVKDVTEVCAQAVRSAKWKWRFRDLIRHLLGREQRLINMHRATRFLAGSGADLNRFVKLSRFKEIRAEILIVQPGISAKGRTSDQNMVLAAAMTYLKETIGADLDVICSP